MQPLYHSHPWDSKNDYCREVTAMERSILKTGCYREVAVVERWPFMELALYRFIHGLDCVTAILLLMIPEHPNFNKQLELTSGEKLTWSPGSEVIKLFPCITQPSMKFFLLINIKMPTFKHFKFHVQLSWAWKKFYNLKARAWNNGQCHQLIQLKSGPKFVL